ncbi:MAG: T9SS type A sorting domain-containing protein, partial [Bacteroidales bacterium]|nr:T9SS type A sorting domain-containing protein [Bacteroidales bacterium]
TSSWAYNLSSETGYSDMGNVATSYTDFYNGFAALTGTGNISSNPLFASTTDFHLQSQYGRWNGTTWVTDDETSPCINLGSTSDSYANEPVETGGAGRIDMGMYGNTAEASKKYPTDNQAPVAVIDNITPSPATQGSAISFTGTGTDADGTIAAYEWSSSINGIFNTLQDPSYSGLSAGTHTISFRVQDNDGIWSTYATRTLVVNNATTYPDMVGFWQLNESTGSTTYDSTVCINNGTITGATHVAGKKNMGLYFTTATTNYVNIPSSASLNAITSAITLSAWVNAETNTNNSNIIERWIYGTGIYQRAYTLYVGSNGTISFGLSNDGTSINAKWLTTTDTISRNQWTHIAATFDGTTMKIYINGTFSKSLVPGFSTIFVPTGNVHIGNWQTTATTWENPFKGSLDEVRLYKKALSESEILGLYNDPATPVAVIDNITPSPATQGSAVSFTGTGTDADGTIAAYEWSSSINGIFNTLQDPSYSGLSVGTHTISFRVQDNSGSWSTYATRTLVVNAAISYPDLVGYWPLDESTGATAYDSTSCANNGTIYGATHVAGKKNMGLNFTTATTNDVEIPSSASLNAITSAITLSAWVNADSNTANSNIIERWIYGTGIYQRAYTLYVGTNGTISFGLSNDGTSTNAKWITTTETISRNQWTHIAATFDGTTMKIYINGTFSKSLVPGFSTIFVPTGNVHIGNWQTTATTWENPFKGSLDEVRLYKKALSASEILGLYNNPANLVADLKFNENAGTIATDNSGNVNTGTLTNSPTWTTGKIGSALNFTNNYVNLPSSTSLNTITSAITLSTWIKASANTANSTIIGRWLYGTGVNQRSFILYVGSTGTLSFGLSNDGTSTNAKWLTTTATITRDVWTYVTATFDGTTMKIYINGSLSTSDVTGFSTIFVPTGNVQIGKWQTTATTWELPFIGAIDEVKVYNKALSLSEIQALYGLTRSAVFVDDSQDKPVNKPSISTKCYPNPFSSEITISYNVPEEGRVRIDIYNSIGQLVSKVVNENLTAGEYSTVWNIESSNAGELANGLYICKLIINGKATASKIMLVK